MVIFYKNDIFPDELNNSQGRFSVDVLAYFPCLDEHSIAWFDFQSMKWFFLSNQDYTNRRFVWRYLDNYLDKRVFKHENKSK